MTGVHAAVPDHGGRRPGGLARWRVVGLLAAAQFVMVLDTTVMNVCLTDVVRDLGTTIPDLQLAITFYALTMAAFMLTGGRLGDVWGRRRAFAIGCAVYGAGSFVTALSPNLAVLLVGWSLVEGLGAALVIPAIVALTAVNYAGRERAAAYGLLGGIAAAGAAAGPLIGGWVSEVASWRWVFAGETVVMLALLARVGIICDRAPERRPRLDGVSVALSALGLALAVFAVLRSSEWGLLVARGGPVIAGSELEPFGLSVVPFLLAAGAGLLVGFARRQQRLDATRRDPLLAPALLRIAQLRGGLTVLLVQTLILNGVFFVLPVYLQTVLGKGALDTGLAILPLSIGVIVLSLGGARLAARFSPRAIVRAGLGVLAASLLLIIGAVTERLDAGPFTAGMLLLGAGIGLCASQLGNVIMSSVAPERSSEVAGVQGTAQNLGAALGTALVGAVLLAALAGNFTRALEVNPAVPASTRAQLQQAIRAGVPLVPTAEASRALADANVPPEQARALVSDYADAQIRALRAALLVALAFVAVAAALSGRLPATPLHRRAPSSAAARAGPPAMPRHAAPLREAIAAHLGSRQVSKGT